MVLSIIASVAAGILVLNMLAAALHENHVFAISYARNSPFSISSVSIARLSSENLIIKEEIMLQVYHTKCGDAFI